MQTLATAVGLTGWSQTQIRNANDAARADIERLGGQKALDMFSRLSAFQEDLTALRKATSGSAAASTVRTMVRAAPIYNVHSSQDFRNQLSATLRTGASALRAYPEINPKYIQWWDDGARMAKGGPVSSQAPQSSGKVINYKIVNDVLSARIMPIRVTDERGTTRRISRWKYARDDCQGAECQAARYRAGGSSSRYRVGCPLRSILFRG